MPSLSCRNNVNNATNRVKDRKEKLLHSKDLVYVRLPTPFLPPQHQHPRHHPVITWKTLSYQPAHIAHCPLGFLLTYFRRPYAATIVSHLALTLPAAYVFCSSQPKTVPPACPNQAELFPQAERQSWQQLRGGSKKRNRKKQRNMRCQLAFCGESGFPYLKKKKNFSLYFGAGLAFGPAATLFHLLRMRMHMHGGGIGPLHGSRREPGMVQRAKREAVLPPQPGGSPWLPGQGVESVRQGWAWEPRAWRAGHCCEIIGRDLWASEGAAS